MLPFLDSFVIDFKPDNYMLFCRNKEEYSYDNYQEDRNWSKFRKGKKMTDHFSQQSHWL
jgi:hypothetical protein